jgi:GTP-binding protein Era
MVIVVNKVDLVKDKSALLPRMAELARLRPGAAIVPVSAAGGLQLDELKEELAARLPEGPALYAEDELTDRDERFLAAEFVREKVFRLVGEEIPYAITVGIDRFEHEGRLRRIFASIYVEKPSQRAIVLGADGERVKAIASAARRDLEALFDGPVYLEVWVRVKKGWSGDAGSLDRLGY